MLWRGDSILVKQLQRRTNGAVALRSDNPAYAEEVLSRDEADDIQIIVPRGHGAQGRVIRTADISRARHRKRF